MNIKQLIFVYNAESGLFNSLSDFAHKILSPSTYKCQLCALTYGNFNMNTQWKKFINTLPVKVIFLHKDEFISKYGFGYAGFPSAYIKDNERIKPLITVTEFQQRKSLEELKQLVSSKVAAYDKHHHSYL